MHQPREATPGDDTDVLTISSNGTAPLQGGPGALSLNGRLQGLPQLLSQLHSDKHPKQLHDQRGEILSLMKPWGGDQNIPELVVFPMFFLLFL